jgi:hypothetical protein
MSISADLFINKIGKNGYNFGDGGFQNAVGVIATPFALQRKEATGPAADFRKSILIYFGQLQLKQNLLATAMSAKTDLGTAYGKMKKIEASIETAKIKGWGANADPMPTIASTIKSSLETAKNGLPESLQRPIALAIEAIMAKLPEILKAMFAELATFGIPVVKDIVAASKKMKECIEKSISIWNARGIDSVLRNGSPKAIVNELLSQLKIDALCAMGEATYSAAKAIAASLTAGASSVATGVIDSIKGFLQFIWVKFKQYREYFSLEAFFAECKRDIKFNFPKAQNKQKFVDWFSPWLSELPIVASHCIASRGTGNYVGFMTAVKDDGSDQTMDELLRGYSQFEALKIPALKYAKSYYHDFKSDQEWVSQSLTIIEKGGLDTSSGDAAKAIGWFQRGLMKIGFKKNTNYR